MFGINVKLILFLHGRLVSMSASFLSPFSGSYFEKEVQENNAINDSVGGDFLCAQGHTSNASRVRG